jgi:hypothetical protein
MKYYISPKGFLHAVAIDGSEDGSLPAGSVLATDAQVQAIQNPPVDKRAAALAQISALEQAQLMPRVTREFMLLWMEANGGTAVPGYAPLKAFDEQIKALRAQL